MSVKVLKPTTIIPADLYVERRADAQLSLTIEEMGRPGYILDPRQMGKTNLLINARRTLENELRRFVYVDLSVRPTSLGGYYRRLFDTASGVHGDVFSAVLGGIDNAKEISAPAFDAAIRAVLRGWPGEIVIVLDEIDALTSSPFSDQVFSHIRSLYFERDNYSDLHRLTYVLAGVAEPSELIRNKNLSPFNIGQKIFLADFSDAEYVNFVSKTGLEICPDTRQRIFHWSRGNPRITWDVLSAVEDAIISGEQITSQAIDHIIERLYLTSFSRPPVDHIRTLVETDAEVRDSLFKLRAGDRLSSHQRMRLYLAGITDAVPEAVFPAVKNPIVDRALSDQWLREVAGKYRTYLTLARASYVEGDFASAIANYERYFSNESVDNSTVQDASRLGIAYFNSRQYAKSIKWLELFRERGKHDAQGSFLPFYTASAHEALGHLDQAKLLYEQITESGEHGIYFANAAARLAGLILPEETVRARELSERALTSARSRDDIPEALRKQAQVNALTVLATLVRPTGPNEAYKLLREAFDLSGPNDRLLFSADITALAPDAERSAVLDLLSATLIEIDRGEEEAPRASVLTGLLSILVVGSKARLVAALGGNQPEPPLYVELANAAQSAPLPNALGVVAHALADDFGESPAASSEIQIVLSQYILSAPVDFEPDLIPTFLRTFSASSSQSTAQQHLALFICFARLQRLEDDNHLDLLFQVVGNMPSPTDVRERHSFALVLYLRAWSAFTRQDFEKARMFAREVEALLSEARHNPHSTLPEPIRELLARITQPLLGMPDAAGTFANPYRSLGRNDRITVRYKDGRRVTAKFKKVQADLELGYCALDEEEIRAS
jgi:tetratricopeptide (TPR) repeat protein